MLPQISRRSVARLCGYLWLVSHYGIRRAIGYERARRAGVWIDYSAAFSPRELAEIEQAFAPDLPPWKHDGGHTSATPEGGTPDAG